MNSTTGERRKQCAIVTGSNNGIGEAIVKHLASLDYKLIVTGRNGSDVKRVAEECADLSPSGLKPLEIVADLEIEGDIDRIFNLAMEHFDNRLHLLVNNAGYGQPVAHTQLEECYAAYKRILQININAAVRLTLLAAPKLKQSAEECGLSSSVVNISSIAGFRPTLAMFAYGLSKAALSYFTESMAVELAPSIRVNCISPGPIETKIIERSGLPLETMKQYIQAIAPLKRMGQPDEVAEAVIFLADSRRSAYITGSNLLVDGGVNLAPLTFGRDSS